MAVLDIKPHWLWTCSAIDGYEDEDGHYHPGSEQWQRYKKCDAVPASIGKNVIQYDDGHMETYSYTLYLTTKTRDFHYGERVKLTRFGEESQVMKVMGFQRYQKQCKLIIGYDGN